MPRPSTRRADLRPEGWSPEWVLAWLIEHPTTPLRSAITQWAEASCGIDLRDRILQELRAWKMRNPAFAEALGEVRPGTRLGRPSAEDLVGDWKARFLEVYRLTHNRKESAERAGVSLLIAKRALQPSRAEFDQAFFDAVKEIEAETVELARAGIKSSMEVLGEATAMGDPKAADALARHSTKILEVREPEEWARQQVTKVGGTVFHLHAEARPRVLANLQAVNAAVAALPPAPAEGVQVLVPELCGEELR